MAYGPWTDLEEECHAREWTVGKTWTRGTRDMREWEREPSTASLCRYNLITYLSWNCQCKLKGAKLRPYTWSFHF
jgi:hypothetical protein